MEMDFSIIRKINLETITIRDAWKWLLESKALENPIHLNLFTDGYQIGCIDSSFEDKYLLSYFEKKRKINKTILEELELPEYLNCCEQLYVRYYNEPFIGIKHLVDKYLLFFVP